MDSTVSEGLAWIGRALQVCKSKKLGGGCQKSDTVFSGYSSRNPIKIATSPWSSAYLNAQIASILLDEAIGVQNEMLDTPSDGDTWEKVSQGNIHMLLEYW